MESRSFDRGEHADCPNCLRRFLPLMEPRSSDREERGATGNHRWPVRPSMEPRLQIAESGHHTVAGDDNERASMEPRSFDRGELLPDTNRRVGTCPASWNGDPSIAETSITTESGSFC